ncbi:hypothetical protein LTR95_007335 [Oleoguttula sp. CCFEE 5521]
MLGHGPKQVNLAIGYERLGHKSWFAGGISDFPMLMDRLSEWSLAGKPGLIMHVDAFTVTAAQVAASSSTQLSQGRRSATNQQLSVAGAVSDELLGSGNLAEQLTSRWICTVKNCDRYTKLCYWAIHDSRDPHYPLYSQILTSWGTGIRAGTLNVDILPAAMVQQVVIDMARLQVKRQDGGSGKKESFPSNGFTFNLNTKGDASVADTAPISSPVRMPSCQSSSIELR